MNEEQKFEEIIMVKVLKKASDFNNDQYKLLLKIFFEQYLPQSLKSQQERLVEEIGKHCYESEEKEQDFCALQGRIGLRNEIIALIKKTYGQK